MYSPAYNRPADHGEIVRFMHENGFALLVTGTGGELRASHLPAVVEDGSQGVVLHMHMAKANAQWQEFFEGEQVLVVFSGPHAYVSPRWYEETQRVPTWNYAAVHAYGTVRVIEERAAKHASQRRLVAQLDPPWLAKFDGLPQAYVDSMLAGIVTFDVAVTRLEARWKLSQNRGMREQALIAAELEKSDDSTARALAALTRRHLAEP